MITPMSGLRRILLAAGLLALPTAAPALPAPPAPAVAPAPPAAARAWAEPARQDLVRAGLWAPADADLGRDATRRDLARALRALVPPPADGLAGLPADVPPTDPDAAAIAAAVRGGHIGLRAGAFAPDAPATGRVAAVAVTRALGLGPEMRGLGRLSTADGVRLRVPAGFAAAVLTRELGLRRNVPAAQEWLERADAEPMPLADLLAMVTRARALEPWRLAGTAAYRDITLPAMTPVQRTVVEAALAQVGRPYVWGGDWPTPASPWGGQARGGFDCSGLVWWAFKGAPAASAAGAGRDLGGRTADAMAWEAPRGRVRLSALAPGDLVFYGARGPRTRRGGVEHVAIALGNGWIVQSAGSRAGVTVSSLTGYWPSGVTHARRPAALGAPPAAVPPVPAASAARAR